MKQALAILQLFFTYNIWVKITSGLGAVLCVGGLVAALSSSSPFALIPGLVFLIMPVVWSGVVFRELVSNSQLALVPRLRARAILAYAFLALVVAALAIVLAILDGDTVTVPYLANVAAIAFSVMTIYLLFAQWCATFNAGWFLQFFGLFMLLNLSMRLGPTMSLVLEDGRSLALAAAALLAWYWLYRSMRHAVAIKGPSRMQRRALLSGSFDQPYGWSWQTSFGQPAGPARTLMRAASDALGNRIVTVSLWVVGFGALGVGWLAMFDMVELSSRGPGAAKVFTMMSVMGVAMLGPMTVSEWPVRARYLWLRSGGDRAALRRSLERALVAETALVTGVAAAAALALLALTDIEPLRLLVYVAGCAVALLFGAFFAFWLRSTGNGVNELSIALSILVAVGFWLIIALDRSVGPVGFLWLLGVFGGLAIVCRRLAKRRFLSIDWCAIRPQRRLAGRGLVRGSR